MGIKTKESELTPESTEFYNRCVAVLDERLRKLNISLNPASMEEIHRMSHVGKTRDTKVLSTLYNDIEKLETRLTEIFCETTGLPKSFEREAAGCVSEYVRNTLGKDVQLSILDSKEGNTGNFVTNCKDTIVIKWGSDIIDAVNETCYAMTFIKEVSSFSKEFADMASMVFPAEMLEWDENELLNFYAKLTGASFEDVSSVYAEQKALGSFNSVLFLMLLYDRGVYKPEDEKIKRDLENLKFVLYPFMRRAFFRYVSGKSTLMGAELMESGNDALDASVASDLVLSMKTPAQLLLKHRDASDTDIGFYRAVEGLQAYCVLEKRLGKDTLHNFEEACRRSRNLPGIVENRLVIINPAKAEMYTVKTEKLESGVLDIEELKGEKVDRPPWFPKQSG